MLSGVFGWRWRERIGLPVWTLCALAVLCGLGAQSEPKAEPKVNGKVQGGDKKSEPRASPKARAGSPAAQDWLTLEVGLSQLRQKYLPAVILCVPPAAVAENGKVSAAKGADEVGAQGTSSKPSALEELMSDTSLKETLKKFALIRIRPEDLEKAYPAPPLKDDVEIEKKNEKAAAKKSRDARKAPAPPGDDAQGGAKAPVDPATGLPATVGARLGLNGSQPAIVVLNYWEDTVITWKEGNPPTRTKLRDELGRIWKVNKLFADEARKVEPELEKSRYAAKLGNQREAVLKVRGFEDAKTQSLMDPVLKKRVTSLIQDLRAKAQKAIESANELDKAKKYQEAIQAFDKIQADYPFQDIQQQTNKRKNECLRKMTVGF